MRGDLETAMAVVLTSRTARDEIISSASDFAGYFDLSPAEAAALAQMARDLVDLMPGYVRKREGALRGAFDMTLTLLQDEGTDILEDYTEAYAPVESLVEEQLRFGDFLIEQIRELPDDLPHRDLIADVARFQRLRRQCFSTEGPLWPEAEADPLDARKIDLTRPLWLLHSAAVEAFGWDVRTVRSAEALARARPGRAHLLCFQRPADAEVTVLRVDDDCARAVELIGSKPGELSAAQVLELIGTARPAEALLGNLIAQGVVKGRQS